MRFYTSSIPQLIITLTYTLTSLFNSFLLTSNTGGGIVSVHAGYSNETLVPLIQLIKRLYMPNLNTLSMIEFGNQEVHDKVNMFYKPHMDEGFYSTLFPTKYFFEHLGIKYISIDLNGMDGSLKLDCRQDITKYLQFKKVDIVTNIGFSEHVGEGDFESNVMKNQYTMFKNMHDVGKVGAIYYHDFMSVFPRHGVVNYDLDFIYALPKKCNYILLFEPFRNPVLMLDDDGEEIVTYLAAYRKVDNEPFMTLEEFSALPGLKNIVGQYGLYRRVTVDIFGSNTLSGERVHVFEIGQVLGEEKSFNEWATYFCRNYFSSTVTTTNVFLMNALDFSYCVKLTEYSINKSGIDQVIRS